MPVNIYAYQLGPQDFRIKFTRGIGWAPTRYKSKADVLAALLDMKTYTVAEARIAKAICIDQPLPRT